MVQKNQAVGQLGQEDARYSQDSVATCYYG